jgi:hypothetical protein
MKLRIKGNSLRLRIAESELARLMKVGRIQETIQFAPASDARLTYALTVRNAADALGLEYLDQTVTVVLSPAAARRWAESDDVGVYADGRVTLVVEKDFACLDGKNPEEDADAFPNPLAGVVC